jgi:hypothetical protein
MRTMKMMLILAALPLVAMALSTTGAEAFSKKVRRACGLDYQDFCSMHDPASSAARRCFESNRRSLSKGCIRALVDAGEVPAKYLRR